MGEYDTRAARPPEGVSDQLHPKFSVAEDEGDLRLSTGDGLFLSDAALLAACSELAYAEAGEVALALPRLGFDFVSAFDRTSTQGFVAATRRELIISFRGTETSDRADVLHDLDARRTRTPTGKVHTGFLAALDKVWDRVERLVDAESGSRAVWLTGHSLGGALAALAASRLAIEHQTPVAGLHTFGQPRVGNRQFAASLGRALANRYYRFINNEDTVPNLPLAFRFRHAGEMCWFNKEGALTRLRGIRAWGKYSTQLFQLSAEYEDGRWQTTTDTLADHRMDSYRVRVQEARRNALQ